MTVTEAPPAKLARVTQLWKGLSPGDWRRVWGMFGVIALLHIVGFGTFIALRRPLPLQGARDRGGVTAYTLGLRHAFDADHISAIDNTTRKLMHDRHDVKGAKRPLSVGYYFSLGHSTIVIAIGAGIVIAEKAVYGAVSNNNSGLEQFGGVFGTIVSASFLYLIAVLNIVILAGIIKIFAVHAAGHLRRGRTGAPASEPRFHSIASSGDG